MLELVHCFIGQDRICILLSESEVWQSLEASFSFSAWQKLLSEGWEMWSPGRWSMLRIPFLKPPSWSASPQAVSMQHLDSPMSRAFSISGRILSTLHTCLCLGWGLCLRDLSQGYGWGYPELSNLGSRRWSGFFPPPNSVPSQNVLYLSWVQPVLSPTSPSWVDGHFFEIDQKKFSMASPFSDHLNWHSFGSSVPNHYLRRINDGILLPLLTASFTASVVERSTSLIHG